MWSLGKELLIQLHLLIVFLFWALPDILDFAWPFVLIKTKGCCISLWLMASKWSGGTESTHMASLEQESVTLRWNVLKTCPLLAVLVQPGPLFPGVTVLQLLLGMGKPLWRIGKNGPGLGELVLGRNIQFWGFWFEPRSGSYSSVHEGFSPFQCAVEIRFFPWCSLHFGSLSI